MVAPSRPWSTAAGRPFAWLPHVTGSGVAAETDPSAGDGQPHGRLL